MPHEFKPAFLSRLKKHKILYSILAIFIILSLARLGMLLSKPKTSSFFSGDMPVYVELGEATYGVMRDVGVYYGSLASPYNVSVAPKIGGQVERFFVDIGDVVESGQIVAQLDDESLILQRNQAAQAVTLMAAQLAEASANLNMAQRDMERQTKLRQEKIVPPSEYELTQTKLRQAEARLAVAQSQLENAKSQLEDANLRLSYTRVTVNWPEAGLRYIASRMVGEGDLVTANTPILSVVSLDPLLVLIDVIEQDYHKINVGQSAQIHTDGLEGEVFEGRVVRVAPVLSPNTRQARVEIEVPNKDLRLKPGMFANVKFIFSEHQNVWSVPEDVPFRRKEGFVIYVADQAAKTVRQVPVTLGLVENGRVELAGLEKMDGPVVFIGQHLLTDGKAYRVPGAEKKREGSGKDGKKQSGTEGGNKQ